MHNAHSADDFIGAEWSENHVYASTECWHKQIRKSKKYMKKDEKEDETRNKKKSFVVHVHLYILLIEIKWKIKFKLSMIIEKKKKWNRYELLMASKLI